AAGQEILLLGATREELSGSVWADVVHGHLGGVPPGVDLEAEQALARVLTSGVRSGLFSASHDLSQGGLIQSLTESVLRFGVGAQVDLTGLMARDGVDATTALFAESGARALVATADAGAVQALAGEHGVPVLRLGVSDDGVGLAVAGEFSVSVAELGEAHQGTLPALFG